MISTENITEIIKKLEKIKERIREESIDWWWLDQGDAALINITKIEYTKKEIKYVKMPKVSIKTAITILLNNLKNVYSLSKGKRIQIMSTINEELNELLELVENIREAHKIIEEFEFFDKILDSTEKGEEEKAELKKIIKGSINWIKEIFHTKPFEWEKRRETFKNIAKKLHKTLIEKPK